MPDDLTHQLTSLRQRVSEADKARATAQAQHDVAADRLKDINAEIRKLGVDPDKAEAALDKLEATLKGDLADIEKSLAEEVAAYAAITGAK